MRNVIISAVVGWSTGIVGFVVGYVLAKRGFRERLVPSTMRCPHFPIESGGTRCILPVGHSGSHLRYLESYGETYTREWDS